MAERKMPNILEQIFVQKHLAHIGIKFVKGC